MLYCGLIRSRPPFMLPLPLRPESDWEDPVCWNKWNISFNSVFIQNVNIINLPNIDPSTLRPYFDDDPYHDLGRVAYQSDWDQHYRKQIVRRQNKENIRKWNPLDTFVYKIFNSQNDIKCISIPMEFENWLKIF